MVKMGVFLAYKNYEIISVATGKVHVFKFHQRCLRANGRANFEYPTICNTDIKIFFQVSIAWAPLATSFECSNFLRILDRASNLSILTLGASRSNLNHYKQGALIKAEEADLLKSGFNIVGKFVFAFVDFTFFEMNVFDERDAVRVKEDAHD